MNSDKTPRSADLQFEMPDLSELDDRNILNYMLNAFFRGAGPRDPVSRALVSNLIRQVDQLVQAYSAARISIREYEVTPNNVISPLVRSIGQFEICVGTLRRAIRTARSIRRRNTAPAIRRRIDVLSENVESKINKFRHAIEHFEEKLLKGEFKDGDPHTLRPRSNSLQLGEAVITYADLADWIRQLHEIASALTDYQETTIDR